MTGNKSTIVRHHSGQSALASTTDAWKRWQPAGSEQWDLRRVWHLHRRAGFGATWAELQRDLKDGVDVSVQRFVNGSARSDSALREFETIAETIGNAAGLAGFPDRLKAWWIYRLIFSPDPLAERLTLMWHNHFATSLQKVQSVRLMWQQNNLLRENCRRKFNELLRAAIMDPAMLIWLDATTNSRLHPNENLARELMELFTLGEGNYSETDVKEVARCLTGLRISEGRFRFVPEHFDDGEKTVLGQSGSFSCEKLLALLSVRPETAKRIAWRLCDTFLGENVVNDAQINQLAEIVQKYDFNLGRTVETILRSRIFFSEANLKSQVASPVDLAISSIRALQLFEPPPDTVKLAIEIDKMEQRLFEPPNVFGWKGGRVWVNTRTLAGRRRFIGSLLAGKLHSSQQPADIEKPAKHHGVQTDRLKEFYSQLLTGWSVTEADQLTPANLEDWVSQKLASAVAQLQ